MVGDEGIDEALGRPYWRDPSCCPDTAVSKGFERGFYRSGALHRVALQGTQLCVEPRSDGVARVHGSHSPSGIKRLMTALDFSPPS